MCSAFRLSVELFAKNLIRILPTTNRSLVRTVDVKQDGCILTYVEESCRVYLLIVGHLLLMLLLLLQQLLLLLLMKMPRLQPLLPIVFAAVAQPERIRRVEMPVIRVELVIYEVSVNR